MFLHFLNSLHNLFARNRQTIQVILMSPRRSGRCFRRDRDFRIAFGVRGRSGILGVLCRGGFVDNTAGAGVDVAASWQCRRSRHGDEGSFTAKLCRVIRRPRTYYAGGKRLFLVVGGCGAGLATMQAVYLLSVRAACNILLTEGEGANERRQRLLNNTSAQLVS
jgi:hypothetical protein